MSNMILFRLLDAVGVATSAGPVSNGLPGTGAANLLTPSPREVWSDGGGAGVHYLDLDLGVAKSFDTFFVGFVGGTQGATAQLDFVGAVALAETRRGDAPRRHFLAQLAQPVAARYVRFAINSQNSAVMTIGTIGVGLAVRTTWNREWGAGRRIIDTGSVEPLPDGGFAFGDGVVKGGFRWTWGDLSDEETNAIYALGLDRGERKPVIVVEDPDPTLGLNERIHYGLFEKFEPYERAAASKTRWSLGVQQWT